VTRQAELAGYPLGPGARVDGTRSDLELDFLAFCDRHRLPRPRVNVRIGRWTVDFLCRAERLAVETDFFDYHRGSVAFEDDHNAISTYVARATPSAATPERRSATTRPR
jgi:hypothetical protein